MAALLPPGTLADINSERLPAEARNLRASLPNCRCAVLSGGTGYDLEDYAYDWHGDRDEPSAEATTQWNALGGDRANWQPVFVGDNADIAAFAVPSVALVEAEW